MGSRNANTTIVEFRNLWKRFGGVEALRDVSFSVPKGEVRGLVGENGAGKSTLVKICGGVYSPSEGEVVFRTKRIREWHPDHAVKLGIVVVHQEVSHSLFLNMTIAQNVFLGPNPPTISLLKFVDRKFMNRTAKELLRSLGIDLDPRREVGRCTPDQRQLILIAKALHTDSQLVIMDEPTTSLSRDEVEILFGVIRRAQLRGTTFLFVSHRLNEVLEICNNITVLRNGSYVGTYPKSVSADELAEAITGRTSREALRQSEVGKDAHTALEVRNLSSKVAGIRNVSFCLKKGEILGLIGLQGSGRSEILMTIFGLKRKDRGEILVNEKRVDINNSSDAIAAGLGFITEERKSVLFYDHDIAFNINSCILNDLSTVGFLNSRKYTQTAQEYVEELRIVTPSTRTKIFFLSGGNQQKVLISRWLAADSRILFCDEPTKGVDVGSKVEIRNKLRGLADLGYSLIFISSDFDEVLSISDRLLIVNNGEIAASRDAGEVTSYDLLSEITRLHRSSIDLNRKTRHTSAEGYNDQTRR